MPWVICWRFNRRNLVGRLLTRAVSSPVCALEIVLSDLPINRVATMAWPDPCFISTFTMTTIQGSHLTELPRRICSRRELPTTESLYYFCSVAGNLSSLVGLLHSLISAAKAYVRYFIWFTTHEPRRQIPVHGMPSCLSGAHDDVVKSQNGRRSRPRVGYPRSQEAR